MWGGTPGEEQIKQLRPATDSKARKVGEEWFTTKKVEEALIRYKFVDLLINGLDLVLQFASFPLSY